MLDLYLGFIPTFISTFVPKKLIDNHTKNGLLGRFLYDLNGARLVFTKAL